MPILRKIAERSAIAFVETGKEIADGLVRHAGSAQQSLTVHSLGQTCGRLDEVGLPWNVAIGQSGSHLR